VVFFMFCGVSGGKFASRDVHEKGGLGLKPE
jgi:hypothetical protein